MTGASIRVEDAAVQGAFARLIAFGGDQTATMRRIGGQLRQHVDERFEDGRGPGGVPWRQSWRAKEQNGQTLIDSGRLRQSITFRAGPSWVEIGTNVRYAAVHQFGATITAKTPKGLRFKAGVGQDGKPAWRRMMQVTIPARPFLGFDATDAAETLVILTRDIEAAAAAGPRA